MSRRASQAGIDAIRQVMKRNGWTQVEVAKDVGFSRSTLNQILSGQAVKVENLEELCHLFDLQIGQVLEPESLSNLSNLDSLVQNIRDRIRPLIQEKCGTMRVLDMSQPIGLGEIYTHVNILEKITGRTRRELAEMLPDIAPENFERFSLGAVLEKRVPGLEAVEKHSKLMILGKPGAGKTTFLKHLAIQCIGGAFQSDRVPLFITLKDFAETDGQPDLMTFIDQAISAISTTPPSHNTQQILDSGHALVLLDGLDEVRETDASRVLRQIQQFSERYSRNTFVITCRIAAREYTFQQFTEVEVADFDDEQIADVSSKWFRCKQAEVKAKRFLQQLKANPPIRDLASSPLLLTLLCLVFEDSGDFPANRAELYQTGVDVLLKKWDTKRNIERDQIYKKLSLKRKEDLLSQIAWRTFETGNYFFKQKELEQQIREFIENLPGASTDEETLNLDSEAVLKSIEAQHGLFVERACSIYSFSHLTFHEYFAARYIVANCNPSSMEDSNLTELVSHLTDKRWREVFLLIVGMLPEADVFFKLLRGKNESLISNSDNIRSLLEWIQSKVNESDDPISSIYIKLSNLARLIDRLCFRIVLKKTNPDIQYRSYERSLNELFSDSITLTPYFDWIVECCTSREISRPREIFFEIGLSFHDLFNIRYFKGFSRRFPEKKLVEKLNIFSSELSRYWAVQEEFEEWWNHNSEEKLSELKMIIDEYCVISQWKFSEEENQIITDYYYANLLLLQCLSSDCYVSREVRQEIEETLLLPIAALENRQQ